MTNQQIDEAISELKSALLESLEASKAEEEAKVRKMKAHYRLSKAKELLRDIDYQLIK